MDRCFRMIEINLLVDRVIPLDEARGREREKGRWNLIGGRR